tara:strand:- start:1822 stop:2037 length:216 start_codon:yes stop_codon:yes gene_type:complete
MGDRGSLLALLITAYLAIGIGICWIFHWIDKKHNAKSNVAPEIDELMQVFIVSLWPAVICAQLFSLLLPKP